jgi:hypothetical protein
MISKSNTTAEKQPKSLDFMARKKQFYIYKFESRVNK